MDIAALRQQTDTELQTLLNEKRHLRDTYRFRASQGQLKGVHVIRQTKADIALLLTLLKQRSLAKES